MNTPWIDALRVLGEHAPVLVAIVVCSYVILVSVTAIVGSLHPDEKRRHDARKVLDRLVRHHRRSRR